MGGVADALLTAGKHIAQSGEYTLQHQGPASGLLSNMLRVFEQRSTQEAAQLVAPLAKESEYIASDTLRHAEMYDQMANGKLSTDPRTARASTMMSNAMDSVYNKHAQAGFKVAPRVKGPYFPDVYPQEVFQSGTKEHGQAVQLLMQRRGKTAAQAEKILDSHNPNQFVNPLTGKFHSIESSRTLHLPELARHDAAVPLEYLVKGTRRFHEKQIFGENGEKASLILNIIRKESGESAYNYARGIYSDFMGHQPPSEYQRTEKAVQSFEVASHLGLAVFSHPAKTIESAFIGGLRPFVKSLNELATDHKAFKDFGMRSGAALQDTMREVRRAAGAENEALGSKVLRATQFMKVVNFQEILHANVGKHSTLDEFSKLAADPKNTGARLRLKTLGLDPDTLLEKGGPDEQDLLTAGYKMSKIVLSGRTALDIPPVWKNTMAGRLLTMFKPFFFNQAKFVKNYVLMPALRGEDFRPLLYASIMYPAVGEAVADLKNFVRGRSQDDRPDWDEFPADRVVDNISQVGGFGIASDVLGALTTGTPTTTYQLLTGPVVGDVVDLVQMLRGTWEQKERGVLRRIPGVGPALSRYVAPPKNPNTKYGLARGPITHGARHVLELFQ